MYLLLELIFFFLKNILITSSWTMFPEKISFRKYNFSRKYEVQNAIYFIRGMNLLTLQHIGKSYPL